jgi:hypothetical protein
MVRLVAPITDQLSVLGCPGSTFAGDAAKRVMVGRLDCAVPMSGSPAHRRKIMVVVRIVVLSSHRPTAAKIHFTPFHAVSKALNYWELAPIVYPGSR